jgi:hypothetical protein
MRWIIIIGVLLLQVSCASEKEKKDSSGNNNVILETRDSIPEITFSKTIHDFGKIIQGEVVGTNFTFTNTGNSNLLVLDASASCGCTVPKWSKEPVSPGNKGTLEVIFDSSGREGKQNKSITVRTNTSDQYIVLYITAEVETEK